MGLDRHLLLLQRLLQVLGAHDERLHLGELAYIRVGFVHASAGVALLDRHVSGSRLVDLAHGGGFHAPRQVSVHVLVSLLIDGYRRPAGVIRHHFAGMRDRALHRGFSEAEHFTWASLVQEVLRHTGSVSIDN